MSEQMEAWVCETCGAVYPEYVNGCPKCWHGDPSTSPEPEVISKIVHQRIDATQLGRLEQAEKHLTYALAFMPNTPAKAEIEQFLNQRSTGA